MDETRQRPDGAELPDRQAAEGRLRRELEGKKRCCANCVYATRPRGRWFRLILSHFAGLLICTNSPETQGEIRGVAPCGMCPNFRAKGERRVRAQALEPFGARVCQIPLTRGKVALVDAADYPWLSRYRWFLSGGSRGPWYAATHINGKVVTMHRLIMNPPKGMWVHHVDDNGLNNCRDNLRLCTPQENAFRRRHRKNATSPFIGVFQRKEVPGKWYAKVRSGPRIAHLGPFGSAIEAARARDAKALEMHGPYARLNLLEEWPPERRAAIMAEARKPGFASQSANTQAIKQERAQRP